jgi:hypothetical protein
MVATLNRAMIVVVLYFIFTFGLNDAAPR